MKLECLTIVFVDIKNYTSKTSDQSRTANERLLARFSSLVKPLVRAFNGTMIKALGDAFLITFKSPTDSLLCAMAVQDQLTRRNERVPDDERFELRFAVNAGEVRVEGRDIFGEAVNVAARIEALADGGEIYFSETVYLMMNRSEVPAAEVGWRKLKGIQDEVRIYRIPKLHEVGAYKLAPTEASAWAQSETAAPLPFGGLALQRVHLSVLGSPEDDATFHLTAALAEAHYHAAAQAGRFWTGMGVWKAVAPFQYLFSLVFGTLAIGFRGENYRGLGLRVQRDWKQIKASSYYRTRLLLLVAGVLLFAGLAGWGWHRYVLMQQAEVQAQQQAVALQEQVRLKDLAAARASEAEARVRKELKQVRHKAAVARAQAKAQKTPEPKKGFHVPWW